MNSLLRGFVLALLLCSLNVSHAQDSGQVVQQSAHTARVSAPTPTAPETGAGPVIYYTGALFGYMRHPDVQRLDEVGGCPAASEDAANPNLVTFLAVLQGPDQKLDYNGRLLLGTGDNFAPQLLARTLETSGSDGPPYVSKDEYAWDYYASPHQWKSTRVLDYPADKALLDDLAAGRGKLEADNVGCFLRRAGYDAIVPGKLDFYFGPERLRELARFLADPQVGNYRPVRMLGANLAVVTQVRDAAPRIPTAERQGRYSPGRDAARPNFPEVVLPWMREVKVTRFYKLLDAKGKEVERLPASGATVVAGDTASFLDEHGNTVRATINQPEAFLCPGPAPAYTSGVVRDPDDFASPEEVKSGQEACQPLPPPAGAKIGEKYSPDALLKFPADLILEGDRGYGLCLRRTMGGKVRQSYCVAFSVHKPFFEEREQRRTLPNPDSSQPGTCASPSPQPGVSGQPDWEPYLCKVVALGKDTRQVAVFGVVDPDLREHVGALNYSWQNSTQRYETEIEVVDPVAALQQVLQYFEAKEPNFKGIKILLAQTPHYKAERLAAAMPGKFNLILSEAESDAPSFSVISRLPAAEKQSRPGAETRQPGQKQLAVPTFVVVPARTYVSGTDDPLQIRILAARLPGCVSGGRECQDFSTTLEERWLTPRGVPCGQGPRTTLAEIVAQALRVYVGPEENPGSSVPTKSWEDVDKLQRLALAVMRDQLHADVSLLQKRDVWRHTVLPGADDDPPWENQVCPANLQAAMDRIFWKGDFVIPKLVKGSTLKQVMAKSAEFQQEDSSSLSLSTEAERWLVPLGIFKDKVTGSYFVNGEPLDENRLYAVAITDYAGLGDTGYASLLGSPFGTADRPTDLKELYRVSSLLCLTLASAEKWDLKGCSRESIDASDYFDGSDQVPFDTTKGFTAWRHFVSWADIRHPRPNLYAGAVNSLEYKVQQRPVWSYSLEKAAVGFTINNHNHGTEMNLASLFAGVPVPQVNAPNTNTLTLNLKMRLTRSSQHMEWFTAEELALSRQLTRHNDKTNSDVLSLQQNLFALEAGAQPRIWHPDKRIPALKGLIAARWETQLVKPLATFSLASGGSLRRATDRTQNLMIKTGLRFDNLKSWIEAGYEFGEKFRSPDAYIFNPGLANQVPCPIGAGVASLANCVTANSAPPNPKITSASTFSPLVEDKFQHGLFLNFKLSVPLSGKDLTYVMDNRGDVFLNRSTDLSIDTKFLDDWSHSLNVPIHGNLSFVPKVEFFFFQNKVDNHLFRSIQSSLTLQYNFDWHSGLPWRNAMYFKSPPSSK